MKLSGPNQGGRPSAIKLSGIAPTAEDPHRGEKNRRGHQRKRCLNPQAEADSPQAPPQQDRPAVI
ncbi:MAG: hypothetical protein ICV61_04145 [Microcoleus sp. Co-bin12]|nr:hypothetical protein [Microcoleus sp. Co-bin12]